MFKDGLYYYSVCGAERRYARIHSQFSFVEDFLYGVFQIITNIYLFKEIAMDGLFEYFQIVRIGYL